MRQIILIITTVLVAINLNAQTNSIVGNWDGVDYWNNPSQMTFTHDGFVSFTINGESLGGENFTVNQQKADLKYELNASKDPMWIDLIVYARDGNIEKGRLKGILKFIDPNNLEILISFEKDRFTSFGKENEESVIFLKRRE